MKSFGFAQPPPFPCDCLMRHQLCASVVVLLAQCSRSVHPVCAQKLLGKQACDIMHDPSDAYADLGLPTDFDFDSLLLPSFDGDMDHISLSGMLDAWPAARGLSVDSRGLSVDGTELYTIDTEGHRARRGAEPPTPQSLFKERRACV